MVYEVLPLLDRATIRAFLNQDRSMSAYALGDLDESFWPMSIFYGAFCDAQLAAVALFYHGFDPAILLTFGEPDGVRAIFSSMTLPNEIYYVLGGGAGRGAVGVVRLPRAPSRMADGARCRSV